MTPETHPDAPSSYIPAGLAHADLQAAYAQSRTQLERLMREPVRDFVQIDELVDRLEKLQLAIKAQHGIKGNNPNE